VRAILQRRTSALLRLCSGPSFDFAQDRPSTSSGLRVKSNGEPVERQMGVFQQPASSAIIYGIYKASQPSKILSVEINDQPWKMGNLRLITLYWEGTREKQIPLGREDI